MKSYISLSKVALPALHKNWAAETTRLKRVEEVAITTPCRDRISAWKKPSKRRPMLCM
jgi:hypothetical protein